MRIFVFYLVVINLCTFLLYAWDKFKARRNKRRVPENELIIAALLGGSVGALWAVHSLHHKTRHWKFRYGLPVILAIQIAGCYLLIITRAPGWGYGL